MADYNIKTQDFCDFQSFIHVYDNGDGILTSEDAAVVLTPFLNYQQYQVLDFDDPIYQLFREALRFETSLPVEASSTFTANVNYDIDDIPDGLPNCGGTDLFDGSNQSISIDFMVLQSGWVMVSDTVSKEALFDYSFKSENFDENNIRVYFHPELNLAFSIQKNLLDEYTIDVIQKPVIHKITVAGTVFDTNYYLSAAEIAPCFSESEFLNEELSEEQKNLAAQFFAAVNKSYVEKSWLEILFPQEKEEENPSVVTTTDSGE